MWFLFMIVGLYLIVPFLRPIVRDEKLLRYFLLLTLIFTFLLPQIASAVSLLSWQYCAEFKGAHGQILLSFHARLRPLLCARLLFGPQGVFLDRKACALRARCARLRPHGRADVVRLAFTGRGNRAVLRLRFAQCTVCLRGAVRLCQRASELPELKRKVSQVHSRAVALELRRVPRTPTVHRIVRHFFCTSTRCHSTCFSPFPC